MARYRRRYRRNYRRSYARPYRRYGGGRRSGGSQIGIIRNPAYWLSAGVGALTDLDDRIPADIKIALATMPFGGRGMVNTIKKAAQGMVFGDLVNVKTGGSLEIYNSKQKTFLGKTI